MSLRMPIQFIFKGAQEKNTYFSDSLAMLSFIKLKRIEIIANFAIFPYVDELM